MTPACPARFQDTCWGLGWSGFVNFKDSVDWVLSNALELAGMLKASGVYRVLCGDDVFPPS